jgi:phenylacetate-coenzyme A ligase PaaK-like adenylate-forming protein
MPEAFDGYHAAVVYHPRSSITVGADLLGIFPVYYHAVGEVLLVGSSPELFRYHPLFRAELDLGGLAGLLLTNGLVGGRTLWRGVRRLAPGHLLRWSPGTSPQELEQYRLPLSHRYVDLPFPHQVDLLDQTLDDIIRRHVPRGQPCGLLLSGGLDSRTLGGFLRRQGVATVALTLGARDDLDLRCAMPVARALGAEQWQVPVAPEVYPWGVSLEATWVHGASGFNNIWSWSLPRFLRGFPARVMGGFLLDGLLGPKRFDPPSRPFDAALSRINRRGLHPQTVTALLAPHEAGRIVDEVIEHLRATYDDYAESAFRREWCLGLSHRYRFHVGGIAWQLAFGAWPVLPVLDRKLLSVAAGLPGATLAGRRVERELLLARFPDLAALPLDLNAWTTEVLRPRLRHHLTQYLADRIEPLHRSLQSLRSTQGPERRFYYRIYDFNGPGWRSVRQEAESYRPFAKGIFKEDALTQLLPPADQSVRFRDGIADASGLKLLLGFLFWAKGHLSQPSDGQARQLADSGTPLLQRLSYGKRGQAPGISDSFADWRSFDGFSAEELEDRCIARLQHLLRHAYRDVPHYRDLWDRHGIRVSDVHRIADLAAVPPLTKEQIREGVRTKRLLARHVGVRRRVSTHTTGSTGTPLFFYGDTLSASSRAKAWQYLEHTAGIERDDERIWLTVPRPAPDWTLRRPISSWITRTRFRQPEDLLSIYHITAEDVPRLIRQIDRQGPYFIYGIASSIRFLAGQAPMLRAQLLRPPRVVIGTSDTFLAQQRHLVSEFFRCPALSRYGSYEIGGGVAQTCPANPQVHHVLSELVVIEVVDEQNRPVKPGQVGRVLVTDLTNEVMPLIRYDIGDVAIAAEPCRCGSPWPVIGEIFGRTSDQITTPAGHLFPAWELEIELFYRHQFKDVIAEYQFIQHTAGQLEMLLVPREPLKNGVQHRLRQTLQDFLGEGIEVTISPVSRIHPEENGKRRLVISNVPFARVHP